MKKILIADDHTFMRNGIILILKDGFPDSDIKEVSGGDELMKAVVKSKWDLVIADIDMPGGNGMDSLEYIRRLRPDLPVLILSMYPESVYAIRVLRAGGWGYLNKSVLAEELITAVERVFAGKKYITEEVSDLILSQDHENKKAYHHLTNREFEIFKMLAQGCSASEIAAALSLAVTTISTHRNRILTKMKLNSNGELTRYAVANGIISDPVFKI